MCGALFGLFVFVFKTIPIVHQLVNKALIIVYMLVIIRNDKKCTVYVSKNAVTLGIQSNSYRKSMAKAAFN